MKKAMLGRVAAVVIGVGALGAAGAVATQAYPATCTTNQVCVYDNTNYGTELGWRTGGFTLQDVSSGNNDKMSSWSNHSVYNACWYTGSNGSGTGLRMNQYTSNPDVGFPWNDSMSSWKGSSC